MKKKLTIGVSVLIVLVGLYILSSGFVKESTAFIENYTVSEDGSEMVIEVGVGSSVGFIRNVKVHQVEDGRIYLDCYCAFGGFNGSLGAKDSFVIPLDEDARMICLYKSKNSYRKVLEKNEAGEWVRC